MVKPAGAITLLLGHRFFGYPFFVCIGPVGLRHGDRSDEPGQHPRSDR